MRRAWTTMSDWTTDAADAIDTAVASRATARSSRRMRPPRPSLRAARGAARRPGGRVARSRGCSAALTELYQGEVWASWLTLGGIFVAARGVPVGQDATRDRRPPSTARPPGSPRRVSEVSTEHRDVVIIGSGPAGLTAAVYTARANLRPGRHRGHRRRRPADADHRRRELPRLPRRDHGPRAHGPVPRAGRALRRRVRDRRRRPRRLLAAAVKRVWVGDTEYDARRGHHLDRRQGPHARPARPSRRCSATASRRARRATASSSAVRRSRSSAAATPRSRRRRFLTRFADKVTLVHRRKELRGVEDHAGPRLREPEDRVPLEQRRRARASATAGSKASSCATSRPARPRCSPVTGLFVAIGHDPNTQAVRRPARPRRERLHRHRSAGTRRRRCRACSRPATCRTTSTARRSPPPDRAAWPRSTPSAISKRSRHARPRVDQKGPPSE